MAMRSANRWGKLVALGVGNPRGPGWGILVAPPGECSWPYPGESSWPGVGNPTGPLHYEPGWSSYALKHEVENWVRSELGKRIYIPQGAFILAAIYRGLKLRRIPVNLGVYVG